MKPTVLLFDIDGTLVTTGGAGRRAIVRALESWGAQDGAQFSFAGMTDRLIVRRALDRVGMHVTEELIDRVIVRYLEVLEDEVRATDPADYRLLPGMLEALDALVDRPQVAVGLGTGNVELGARIKLARVGVSDRFAFGGFGCDAEDRAELVRIGAERGAARLGAERAACRVVVIGDTPLDIAAARAVGAEAFAVATGGTPLAELAPHQPEHLYQSLAAEGALGALLGPA
jgi:phosphoglycolate phosphatase-like HAD superfamily hydrolase